jgi:uncharacterized protein YeaO (DUF488 family)
MIQLKRAYEAPARRDGLRILVERLWPRGVSKKDLAVDLWLKALAPSTALRKWFHHDPDRWVEFQKRYRLELRDQGDLVALLRQRASEGPVTFVYAAQDETRNSATVLKGVVERRPSARSE